MSQVTTPQLVVIGGIVTEKQDQTANVATTWTSATALNTTSATYAATGYGTANVGVRVPTTTTAGAITIEVSQDGTDWVPASASRQDNGLPENPILLPYFPGTNGTRIYAFSIDAFTLIRVRLSTVIVGTGNVVITIGAVAGGIEPLVAIRSRKAPTYRAVFAVAARPYDLSNAFGAAGRKQYATIHHAAASTKTVRLRHVSYQLNGGSAAVAHAVDLVRITAAPATGNPAITPAPLSSADAAAETTCLALPTTAGTEGAVLARRRWNVGATGSAPTAAPPPEYPRVVVYDGTGADHEAKAPEIRAGVLEGFAVTFDANGASTITAIVEIEFTEEPA